MTLPRDRALLVILLLAALLGLVYNGALLLGYGPDEPRHMNYVRLLTEEHTLPRINPDGSEYHGAHTLHPPLYYLLLTPFYAAARALPHDWGWHLVRLISLALCLATLPLIYQIAERAGGGSRAVARLAVAQVALLPMFGMIEGAINNDSLTLLAVTFFLWLLVVKYPRDQGLKSAVALGLCFGLGGLCKATALICDGAAFAVYLLMQEGARAAARSPRAWQRLGIVLLFVLLLSGPWYLRNLHLYGQFTPIPSGYSLPALPKPSYGILIMLFAPNFPAAFAFANWGIFYSLWSQKDWIPNGVRLPVYLCLAGYCLLALAGLARRRWAWRVSVPEERLAVWVPFSAFAWNWITCASIALFVHWGWAEGGRYLLPSISGLSIPLALGWRGLVGEKRLGIVLAGWTACLLALNGLAVYWLLTYLNPLFGPGERALNKSPGFRREDICVVIPTLNEAATLPAVVAAVRPFCREILVVDSGSTDGTLDWARQADLRLEVLAARGKGLALRHALAVVSAPITVFVDADGSHDPADIPALAGPILSGEADMVVGSRWTGGSEELHGDMNKWLRRSGSRLLTTLINLRFGGRLSDIQNGFRALDTQIGAQIGLQEDGFTIEQEMVMKFLAGGFRVINAPSHEYARQGGEAKLNLSRVWFQFGAVVLRHLFGLSRPGIHRQDTR